MLYVRKIVNTGYCISVDSKFVHIFIILVDLVEVGQLVIFRGGGSGEYSGGSLLGSRWPEVKSGGGGSYNSSYHGNK